MYRQPIIIFGIVVPSALLILTSIVIWVLMGKFELKRDSQNEALKARQLSQVKERALEKALAFRKGQMAYWNEQLQRDVLQNFNETLDSVLGQFEGNQIRMMEGSRPQGEGELGLMSGASYVRFALVFEGGYGPMQEMMAELEARMPQLTVESMVFAAGSSSAGAGGSIKLTVTYLAWQKI